VLLVTPSVTPASHTEVEVRVSGTALLTDSLTAELTECGGAVAPTPEGVRPEGSAPDDRR
jgi:hypothetical protein